MDKDLMKRLLDKHISPTPFRVLVLENLLKQQTAGSLTDIELELNHADRVTLYRTIKTFEYHGLVHKIDDGSGTAKYAICEESCAPDNHHDLHVHFHCNKCAETYCLPDTKIPTIPLPAAYRQEEMNLVIKGTCAACNV